jgi:hypothetical protein
MTLEKNIWLLSESIAVGAIRAKIHVFILTHAYIHAYKYLVCKHLYLCQATHDLF